MTSSRYKAGVLASSKSAIAALSLAAAAPMLGHAVGSQHNGIALVSRGRESLFMSEVKEPEHRASSWSGERMMRNGRFDRFVMFSGEGAVQQNIAIKSAT